MAKIENIMGGLAGALKITSYWDNTNEEVGSLQAYGHHMIRIA